MLNKVLFLVFFVVLLNGKQLYNNPKEYMIINKEDWILGVVKLDINFNNGEFGSTFGFFLDEDTIITSSAITSLGFPLDINVKIKDDNADLIICIAKARLLASDANRSLAMLKIKNYTDDYCNYSNEKIYHQELIRNQKIQIPNYTKPAKKDIVSLENPFFYKNCIHTMSVEQGMPYFDNEYNLIGISSNNKIITVNEIINFINDIHSKRLQ